MEWETLRQQLEQALRTTVRHGKRPWEEWRDLTGGGYLGKSNAMIDGSAEFFLYKDGAQAQLFIIPESSLTAQLKELVELTIETRRSHDKKTSYIGQSDEERKAGQIGEWFRQQAEAGAANVELPDNLVSSMSLYSTKIPILLQADYAATKKVAYHDLKKLLESFFDADIVLIPLMDKEWLILGSDKLLHGENGDEREYGEDESIEDSLAAAGMGLREMLANEWLGECQVAVHYPMMPAKSLFNRVLELREAMMIGRAFHIGTNLHLPWLLQMEKLIYHIPEEHKADFLEKVLRHIDVVMDAETLTTLEQFFSLDCNVSETAKKLYIHRNTLLYRLDKFKQETGLDVRTFNHAVLVKIALLLYKVTKRK